MERPAGRRFGFVLSHPSRDETARWMGHPEYWGSLQFHLPAGLRRQKGDSTKPRSSNRAIHHDAAPGQEIWIVLSPVPKAGPGIPSIERWLAIEYLEVEAAGELEVAAAAIVGG